MKFRSILIQHRVYLIKDSNFLRHVVQTFLKTLSLKFYRSVSTRWIQTEFWIIRMQSHINISTINSANLTCDIDVDIVENFVKSSRFRHTVQILIRDMMLNRKYQYFEVWMLILHFLQFFSRFFDLFVFELLLFFFVVVKKTRSLELYWKYVESRNVIASEVI